MMRYRWCVWDEKGDEYGAFETEQEALYEVQALTDFSHGEDEDKIFAAIYAPTLIDEEEG